MSYRALLPASLAVLGAVVAVGCGDAGDGDAQPSSIDPKTNIEVFENGFESDDPSGKPVAPSGGGSDAGASASGTSSGGSSSGSMALPAANDSEEAARAVQEADIVKLDGGRLYALSQYGGLAIVDISDPAHMRLLGRKRMEGMPFEMYVENGRAYVTLNDFGRWVEDGDYGQWVQTSELMALDVSNPSNISELGHYDVPGEIADSRLVGDALYLVTFENGYCWNCGQNPATIVTSFGVKSGISKVDQIAFRASNNTYSYWRRSVSATNQRLYIGGPSWSWDGYSDVNRKSIIQVVDISDPAGHLKRGADVTIAGQINSRWQMDEYEGYLRVVSQFGNGWIWNGGSVNPVVETFKVNDSSTITAAGQTQLTMPQPESLQSVRFDGPRGYAITARQMDPLYTIDLSSPAAPKQVGTLEMPGSIFHMEPRGDRVVGFGNDNGSLAVSLFDVSDMAKPVMLSRVSVGSGWASLGEDADRIHKAVRVLDQDGTILLPFASYGRWWDNECTKPQSGIQIIDYAKTGLKLRGLAPHYGQPRRAMLLPNGHLLGMSDRSVSTFDISSRDNPTKTGELDLSNPAYRAVETPTHIASMTSDWWSGEPMLSLTPRENADDANPTGKLSLKELAATNDQTSCGYYGGAYTAWYDARLFAQGSTVLLTVPVYNYGSGTASNKVVVAAIDTSNPAAPKLVGKTEIPLSRQTYGYYGYGGCTIGLDGYAYYSYFGGYYGNLVGAGDSFVLVNGKLAYLEIVTDLVDAKGNEYDGHSPILNWSDYHYRYSRILHTVDVSNPQNLVSATPLNLPESLGNTPLHVQNGAVLTSRWIPSPTTPGKVRFYIDRVDLSGASPVAASVNVPGSLLHVDGPSNRIVTTDYHVTRFPATDWNECYERGHQRGQFDYESKTCIIVDRDFKLADLNGTRVTLRQTFTPPSQNIGGVQLTDDRIYMTHYSVYDYHYANGGSDPYHPTKPTLIEAGGLWAIGGLRDGHLSIVSQFEADAQWPLAAQGTKVAVYQSNGLAVYDTAAAAPNLVSSATLRGYGYSSYVLLSSDHAVASLGEWGLQTVRW
jgi:hypothetical protein